MSSKEETGGIGFLGLLQLALIILKLCGVIAWSWWLVVSPTWVPSVLYLLFMLFVIVVQVNIRKRKKRK